MKRNDKIIYLVDGSSYIHRAYHAIRNLSNSKGLPTNAVLGFTRMILKLLEERDPRYLAVAFDTKGPTFRHRIYPAYKANRPPMPEDLAVQIPLIKRVVDALNVKRFELPGYEADDIIGTLARQARDAGYEVVLVTGDKDFRQLVAPGVTMWDTMKDAVTDYHSLRETYGLEPGLFVDVMGLSGDRADNIPGVPGVGEKTAVQLVRTFGDFDGVFERLHEIKKKKLKENLQKYRDQAALSKTLVTIDCRVPLDQDVGSLRIGPPREEELSEIFRECEFRGLWDRFASRGTPDVRYRLCMTEEDLGALVAQIKEKGLVSVDTETTGRDPLKARLVGISFSTEERSAVYLPLGHAYPDAPAQLDKGYALEALKEVLEDQGITKIGQNIKYDAHVLAGEGVCLRGIGFDTMIASYVINPGLRQHSLDHLAQHYLNRRMISYKEVVGKDKTVRNFSQVPLDRAMEYACEDADITLRLKTVLARRLEEDGNEELFYNLEMRLLPVLMEMERAGIKVDTAFFRELSARMARRMEEIEEEIYREAGMKFNINSPQQLGEVLFEKLGLPAQGKTTKTKRYSTDVRALRKLAGFPQKTPGLILRYRTLSKLKSTYLDALLKQADPRTGRVHTSFNQTVAATGRLSSSDPNLQNIPARTEEGRQIRKGFVAEKGHLFVSADYSQVELRILAHYSQDRAFLESFRLEEDIHTRTASEILGVDPGQVTPEMRRIAKAINFGIIYGMGPQKLSDELGIDPKAAKDYIETYYRRYEGVARFREEAVAGARERGYVTTLLNRRRYLPDLHHANRVIRAEAERMAVNTPIQGTAADLIKLAMIRIHHRLRDEGSKARMLLQVHDELLFEVPEEDAESLVPLIREEMEGVYPLDVPLKVDVHQGRNWEEAH